MLNLVALMGRLTRDPRAENDQLRRIGYKFYSGGGTGLCEAG